MPPKTSDQAAAEVARIFGALSMSETLSSTDYQARPGFGKTGRALQVYANMYRVNFKKDGLFVWHYDVDINPVVKVANQKKPRQLLQDIWVQATKEATGDLKPAFAASAFDFVKNCWSSIQFPMTGDKCEVVVALTEDGEPPSNDSRRFKIVIRPALEGRHASSDHKIDLGAIVDFCQGKKLNEQAMEEMLVGIQAMNVLFRQKISQEYKAVGAQGRRFFGTANAEPIPEGGMVYKGFIQSCRFTNSGFPAMQLDTAYSAFVRPGPLLDYIADLLGMGGGGGGGGRGGTRGGPRGGGRGDMRGGFGGRGGAPGGGAGGASIQTLTERDIRRINDILRRAKFTVTHRPTSRIFSMHHLTKQPASEMKFMLEGKDGKPSKMISIVDYFKQQYNVQVTKPRLPCVSYGKNNYVPLEFVKLAEFNSIPFLKISGDQAAAMIKIAAKRPDERLGQIKMWRQKLNWEALEKAKAWNVSVATEMMEVKARVLPPPNVAYMGGKTTNPRDGGWNMRGLKFAKAGKPLRSWAVVNLDGRCPLPVIQEFLTGVLANSNCPVDNKFPPIVEKANETRLDVGQQGFGCIKPGIQAGCKQAYVAAKNTDPQLIVILIPRKDLALYKEIKRCAAQDLKQPVVTQVLVTQKIGPQNRGMDQYLGNVSLKIHAKLGGVTHFIPNAFDKTTMLVGADVTHPPPVGGPIAPSIAVTIAATSGDNNLFFPCIRLQEGRKELITDLQSMMKTHYTKFRQSTGNYPTKVVLFRDGVSEGQYGMCASEEYDAMLKAARELDPKYRPRITFVVCAKRNSMRFFAKNPNEPGAVDRGGNLPAGTCVDVGVAHPYAFDFYLQAHAGLVGTAKPTHYIVIKDDNAYTADSMQGLCNALCYSYARATRSVSLIPVAYYCDIIAGKCRDLVYSEDSDTASTVASSSGRREQAKYDPLELKRKIEDSVFNSVAWYM